MYRGTVEPHLRNYCSVWGACGGTRLQVLQKLQNRAARIVTNSSYDSSASALIKNSKLAYGSGYDKSRDSLHGLQINK